MPIYEYACPDCGVFEQMVHSYREKKNELKCPRCGTLSENVPSLPTMQPDDAWHTGVRIEAVDQTFRSRKEAERELKKRGIAQAEPGSKVGPKGQQNAVRRRKHIEEHLKGYAT